MPLAWHQAMAAWRAADMARRVALPERAADPAAGDCIHDWLMQGAGYCHRVRLLVPPDRGGRRQRCDRYVLEIDGQAQDGLHGLTAALDEVRARWLPRQASRAQRRAADVLGEIAA